MKNDRVRFGDCRDNLFDGAVADSDEDDLAGRCKFFEIPLGSARSDAGERPADSFPGTGKGPSGAAIPDDAEFHELSVFRKGDGSRGGAERRREAVLRVLRLSAPSA